MGQALVTNIVADLTDEGREKVLCRFKKIESILSLDKLLEFIRATPSVVKSSISDPFSWVMTKFGETPVGSLQSDNLGSTSGAGTPAPSNAANQSPVSHKKNQN
ncbi:hypothetical protein BGZ65_006857, partial [Modicella reniformis]